MSDVSVPRISSLGGQGVAGQSTQVSPPGQKTSHVQPISDAELMQAAWKSFDPALLDSDLIWDSIGAVGSLCFVLYSLQKKLRSRARKYHSDAQGFLASVMKLLLKRCQTDSRLDHNFRAFLAFGQRIEARLGEPRSQESPLSQRQRSALNDSLPAFARLFAGQANEHDAQTVMRVFNVFAKGKPGPELSPLTAEIRKCYAAAPVGKKPTYSWLATKFFPHYEKASGHDKRRIREEIIRPAIRPIEVKKPKA